MLLLPQVDCVGNHALTSSLDPLTYRTYHTALLDRLGDTGVSVRKSVVKILKLSLTMTKNKDHHSATLLRLIQRASQPTEEPSVKDLVREAVREAW